MIATVATPVDAYIKASEPWQLIQDLLGGTTAMRSAGRKWLPLAEGESATVYQARLNRTVLFAALEEAIDGVVSRPFSRNVVIRGTLPDEITALLENFDGSGTPVAEFAARLFRSAVTYGIAHVLVDFPPRDMSVTLSKADTKARRPYATIVSAPNLIGWRLERNRASGELDLQQIRITETATVDDGMFGTKSVDRIRVWNAPVGDSLGAWAVWERAADDWILIDSGEHTFDGIPLSTLYIDKRGDFVAAPVFERIAWLNLNHWQSTSEQRNILHYARVPFLFRSGFSEDELNREIRIGSQESLGSSNPDANVQWIEHKGKSIDAGEVDLEKIENRMTQLAMQPFVLKRTGRVTATEKVIEQSHMESSVQRWIRATEQMLLDVLKNMAAFLNVEIPDDVSVNIFNEFGISVRSTEDARIIDTARIRGDIDHRTWTDEMRRRGILSEDITSETIIARLEDEPAVLVGMAGAVSNPPGGNK